MTSLELTLARVLAAIEQARDSRDPRALEALEERKRAICEALAAPEQSWLEPPAQVSRPVARPRHPREKVLEAAL